MFTLILSGITITSDVVYFKHEKIKHLIFINFYLIADYEESGT